MGQNPVDYDALAKQHGGTPDYDALASAAGAVQSSAPMVEQPDFRTTNAVDAEGHPVVSGVSSLWSWLNTSPIGGYIKEAADAIANATDAPTASGRPSLAQSAATVMNPLLGPAATMADALDTAMPGAQMRARVQGAQAGAAQGLGNVAEGFTTPIGIALALAGLGPESSLVKHVPALRVLLELPAVQKAQRAIYGAAGAGFAAHGAATIADDSLPASERVMGLPEMAAGAAGVASSVAGGRPSAPRGRTVMLTPEEQASNTFADQQGIPLDAATRTGSRFVRSVQKRAANSMGGEATAAASNAAQAEGLRRVGGELADRMGAPPLTPEDAGLARREAMQATERQHGAYADEAYQLVRDIEAANVEKIPTAPEGSATERGILRKLASNAAVDKVDGAGDPVSYRAGRPPTRRELAEMRLMEIELDAMPYNEGGIVPTRTLSEDEARFGGNNNPYVQARGGAPVYQDILEKLPGTSDPTRAELLERVRHTLETGEWTNEARAAWQVAQQRIRKSGTPQFPPALPKDLPLLGTTRDVGLPVHVGPAKQALQPIYDRLLRQKELTGSLMGDSGRALVALDRLMQAPEYESLSIVDQALGDLKAFARADLPELRTKGQGVAAQAIKALEAQVQASATRAGAMPALEEGRRATVQRAATRDALEPMVGKEGVALFEQMVAPKDRNAAKLRDMVERTPEVAPKIARAWFDRQLDLAIAGGRFEHADKLWSEWEQLGPVTKRTLIPDPEHRAAVGRFFLLAKRLSENPNPSGTAHVATVFNVVSQVATYPLAKLIYSPKGAQALARFMSKVDAAQRVAPPIRVQRQHAALAELATAMRAAGLQPAGSAQAEDSGTEQGAQH